MSWWDMEQFAASHVINLARQFEWLKTWLKLKTDQQDDAPVSRTEAGDVADTVANLRVECDALGLRITCVAIDRLLWCLGDWQGVPHITVAEFSGPIKGGGGAMRPSAILSSIQDVEQRMQDEQWIPALGG